MLAKIYAGKKDYANAYKNIGEAIEHDSTDDNSYYHLGIIQFGEKSYDAAIVSFDKQSVLAHNNLQRTFIRAFTLFIAEV
jgi:tetratricopeptide (TPR) repeat protein